MGGGKVHSTEAATTTKKGFNSMLPGANLKEDKGLDKMAYYDQAAKDSSARNELLKNDPYYKQQQQGLPAPAPFGSPYYAGTPAGLNASPYTGSGYADPNEARIYQKLGQLNATLAQPEQQKPPFGTEGYGSYGNIKGSAEDIARLEKMMEAMNKGGSSEDPEMSQLNGMLEKIMDIQNPGRQQEKLRQLSEERKGRVFAITAAKRPDRISLIEEKSKVKDTGTAINAKTASNGFYSTDDPVNEQEEQNAVDAVIAETQTLVSGSTVKMRLLDDIFVNGILIPKDQFLYGTAALSGERLVIKIPSIRFKKSVYPVSLSVMDIDGLEGIYIPGAIARDVAKESTDRAIQDLSFGSSMSNSIGIQAAGTGLEAAKSFFSKKVKLIKVTVKAGYKVLLRDEKQKQDN
nr:conjugative transposon protein TraM [Pedobacter sp. ASV19]